MKVAVYGTLKKGRGNHGLLSTSQFLGDGLIHGYDMYSVHGGFPCIVPSKSGEGICKVEVYEVNEETLARLDMLEGYRVNNRNSSMYLRDSTDIAGIGVVMFYVWNGDVDGLPKALCR